MPPGFVFISAPGYWRANLVFLGIELSTACGVFPLQSLQYLYGFVCLVMRKNNASIEKGGDSVAKCFALCNSPIPRIKHRKGCKETGSERYAFALALAHRQREALMHNRTRLAGRQKTRCACEASACSQRLQTHGKVSSRATQLDAANAASAFR